jgi:hypothetical protein
VEHRTDIRLVGLIELLVADVLERLDGELLAGVVDEDVEAAKPLDRLCDERAAVDGIHHVAGDRHGGAALRLDEFDQVQGILLLDGEVGDRDIRSLACACACAGDGDSTADTGISFGDERVAPGGAPGASIGTTAIQTWVTTHYAATTVGTPTVYELTK